MLVRYVARILGVPRDVAVELLAQARARSRPPLAATLFVIATAWPLSRCLPAAIRRRAIMRFVAGLFATAAPGLAYVTRDAAHLREPRKGLLGP